MVRREITTYYDWLEIADDEDKKAIGLFSEVHNAAFAGDAYEGNVKVSEKEIEELESKLIRKYSKRGYHMPLMKC